MGDASEKLDDRRGGRPLTETEQALIAAELEEFLRTPARSSLDMEIAAVARAAGALPAYADMGGVLFIRPTGEVLLAAEDLLDEGAHWEVETEPMWINTALVSAARRYERLAFLRPFRPESAHTCGRCSGVGRMRIVALEVDCTVCWTRGWIEGLG